MQAQERPPHSEKSSPQGEKSSEKASHIAIFPHFPLRAPVTQWYIIASQSHLKKVNIDLYYLCQLSGADHN